jgi:microsomal dipeptidase-like Zn-dependent dipeptidase
MRRGGRNVSCPPRLSCTQRRAGATRPGDVLLRVTQKFSSLHDDLLWPCVSHACGMGELGNDGRRFPLTERSPLVRAAQFGVPDSPPLFPGTDAYDAYCTTLVPAVSRQYETVVAAVFDRYFTSDDSCDWPPAPPTQQDRERSTFEDITRYLSFSECGLSLAKTADTIHSSGSTNMVLAIEGMDFIHSETQIATLLEMGVRIFALQYNKPNTLTTGDCLEINPSNESGLTELGQHVVRRLFAAGAVVDLAHSAPGTRTDILDYADEQGYGNQVAYTHGAILESAAPDRVLRMPGRFITRDEARRILRLGGIVGLTPALPFTPSLLAFADQIHHLLRDTENDAPKIALGTDFGGIWDGALLPEIRSVTDLGRIGEVLAERHDCTDGEIDAVLRTNATFWLKQALRNA